MKELEMQFGGRTLMGMRETLYQISTPKEGREGGRMAEIHYCFAEEHVHIFLIAKKGRCILWNLKQICASCHMDELDTRFHNYNFDQSNDENT